MNKGQANTELLHAQHSFDVVIGDGRHSLANYNIWLKYHIWGGSALTVFGEDVVNIIVWDEVW